MVLCHDGFYLRKIGLQMYGLFSYNQHVLLLFEQLLWLFNSSKISILIVDS